MCQIKDSPFAVLEVPAAFEFQPRMSEHGTGRETFEALGNALGTDVALHLTLCTAHRYASFISTRGNGFLFWNGKPVPGRAPQFGTEFVGKPVVNLDRVVPRLEKGLYRFPLRPRCF